LNESNSWPELDYESWRPTSETLHMWTQIVGKIRMVQTPWINHSWHVPLYVSARGLSTHFIPCPGGGFEIEFDFSRHQIRVVRSDGRTATRPLQAEPVAAFYRRLMSTLSDLGLNIAIHTVPNEIRDAIPFDRDEVHRSYDEEAVRRFWMTLMLSHRVFTTFRARFIGKSSPVHFFWGSFDLAVSRFSGREAPRHAGGIPNMPDFVAREAYSHEVSSSGFWPGAGLGYPAYYSYTYPAPDGFASARIEPEDAFFSADLGEFVLPYESVRRSGDPEATLLGFLQSTYEAGANLAAWDRSGLERPAGWDPWPPGFRNF
jgi:hypothetical protein